MRSGLSITVADGPATRLGRIAFAGEVIDDEPVVRRPWRRLDHWVLSALRAGAGVYRHRDGRTEAVRPGELIVVPPGTPHWYGTSPGQRWTETWLVFGGALFDSLGETGVLPSAGVHRPRIQPPLEPLHALIRRSSRLPGDAERQILDLLHWLVESFPPPAALPMSAAVSAAIDVMAADPTALLSMPEVSAAVGLPYDTFRQRFAAELGQPPLRWRNRRRLATAANLLRSTDMTVRAVAHALGYADEFHFSHRFRAEYGVPPSAYPGLRKSGTAVSAENDLAVRSHKFDRLR